MVPSRRRRIWEGFMIVTCWSVKGGSGTTVVAAALSLLLARRCPKGTLAVDLGGDMPAALGLPEPPGPGVVDWLAVGPEVAPDALERLAVEAGPGLRLLGRGGGPLPDGGGERLLAAVAPGPGGAVVVDAGPSSGLGTELASAATVSLLVLRPCYLALRRALAAPLRPSAVVLIAEPNRSLDARDVEDVLGVPVRAVVPYDPRIARCVDAGLLSARLPRPLLAALRSAA
ncbi:MAG: hypothetical protein KY439_07595 [Actinobacteria bacterium]|nr:hypothetical protein [Actinomycetota bacterium]